jgi:hypothetical protein
MKGLRTRWLGSGTVRLWKREKQLVAVIARKNDIPNTVSRADGG